MKTCHKCKKEVNINKIIGRKNVCPFCQSDLRSCLNCRHHDPNSYNQCRESQAERTLEKKKTAAISATISVTRMSLAREVLIKAPKLFGINWMLCLKLNKHVKVQYIR
jgi:hypothetical protein